jgi:hypothetical protein
MEGKGLLMLNDNLVTVTEAGRQFIRIICQAFDMKWLQEEQPVKEKMFSNSI